ncbi:MAG: HAMP domain-containing sensor histidine kinase [Acidimicrobiia bacterium]|nr:HAMP domain-containing sensor histidine kinase [Acidimicrobiia bacterium]
MLRLAALVVPIIFAAEWIIELSDDDPGLLPNWRVYLVFWLIPWILSRRARPNALYVLIPAAAFLALGTGAELVWGVNTGVPDQATSLALLVGIGMLTGFMVYERFLLAVGVSTVAVGSVAFASGLENELVGDDLIIRVVTPMLLVALASWLIHRFRSELNQRAVELMRLVDARDQLVVSVSHELRTPLTAIAGFSQELVDNWPKYTSEQAHELTGIVAAQAHEMGDLVEDLLVAARDREDISLYPEPVDLRTQVDDVLDTGVVPSLTGAREGSISGQAVAWADPLRCRQIIRNLFSNAQRYGGTDITVTIGVENGSTFVAVSDDGAGLHEDDLRQVFEPYFSAHAAERAEGSIGLGLPVSRSLARLMGGDVTCEVDDRTTFQVTLPAHEHNAA